MISQFGVDKFDLSVKVPDLNPIQHVEEMLKAKSDGCCSTIMMTMILEGQ